MFGVSALSWVLGVLPLEEPISTGVPLTTL